VFPIRDLRISAIYGVDHLHATVEYTLGQFARLRYEYPNRFNLSLRCRKTSLVLKPDDLRLSTYLHPDHSHINIFISQSRSDNRFSAFIDQQNQIFRCLVTSGAVPSTQFSEFCVARFLPRHSHLLKIVLPPWDVFHGFRAEYAAKLKSKIFKIELGLSLFTPRTIDWSGGFRWRFGKVVAIGFVSKSERRPQGRLTWNFGKGGCLDLGWRKGNPEGSIEYEIGDVGVRAALARGERGISCGLAVTIGVLKMRVAN
jgi:hypothetical protein